MTEKVGGRPVHGDGAVRPRTPEPKKVLMVPLDPVHDVGLKLIRRALSQRGHEVVLLPPDLPPEEVVQKAGEIRPDCLLVSRTISYGTAELLARFLDLLDTAGLRDKMRVAVGGMSIRPELAQEMGFDAGFGPDTTVDDAVAFVEDREFQGTRARRKLSKPDLTEGFSYRFKDEEIGCLCHEVAQELLSWAKERTSPGVLRAEIREEMERARKEGRQEEVSRLRDEYARLTGDEILRFYREGTPVSHTRPLTPPEARAFSDLEKTAGDGDDLTCPASADVMGNRVVFVQYGTGCPLVDSYHIVLSQSWGARGVVHFDPSWGARQEGLLEGTWSHQHDGTVITLDNLQLIKKYILPWTLWQVRAHRGLNTPETVVLAALAGADLTKVNMVYGSLAAGTDPERLCVDGVKCLELAARFGLPYDVVTNEELAGVPAAKAFAGMLVVMTAGVLSGGRPILQPLFARSPEAIINGIMDEDFVDFNAAKMMVLADIVDAPVWPGAPVGFLTQSQDRVQSSTMTALHAALALHLGSRAVTIASSDEAYAGGPITGASRVDSLKSVAAALRFFGQTKITPSPRAASLREKLREDILNTLKSAVAAGSLVDALYAGVFGSREDGAYPGRAGRGTVTKRS